MTTVIYDFTDEGNFEAVATMAVILLTATFALVAVSHRFIGRSMIRSEVL